MVYRHKEAFQQCNTHAIICRRCVANVDDDFFGQSSLKEFNSSWFTVAILDSIIVFRFVVVNANNVLSTSEFWFHSPNSTPKANETPEKGNPKIFSETKEELNPKIVSSFDQAFILAASALKDWSHGFFKLVFVLCFLGVSLILI